MTVTEKGIKNIGHWSITYRGWWEKNIYTENVLRVPVPSFTFSEQSLTANGVLTQAKGIVVIMDGQEYHLWRESFNRLVRYNYGNGWNYRCPVTQFNNKPIIEQPSLF